jgi:hypothetical protein
MDTHLCLAQLEVSVLTVQVLNCFIQPGEQQELKDLVRRIVDIAKDIVKHDQHAPIVVCGEFNNHIAVLFEALNQ